jgi:hypothetical protein
MSKEEVIVTYQLAFGGAQPEQGLINAFTGKAPQELLNYLLKDPSRIGWVDDLKTWKRRAIEELTPALADALEWKRKAIEELQPKIDELEKQATDKATSLKPGLYRVV